MQQAFGIQALDGSILGIGSSREALEKLIKETPFLIGEIIPLEINTEPLTKKGRQIQDKIRRVWEEKKLVNLHFDKQPGWFKLSADERTQFILDMISMDPNDPSLRPLDIDGE